MIVALKSTFQRKIQQTCIVKERTKLYTEAMDLQKLAEVLSERRRQLGMPLTEVARRTGIDRYNLWVYERGVNPRTGKPSRPAKDRLERLAAVLSFDPDEQEEFLAELLELAGYREELAAVPDFAGLVHAAKPVKPVRTRTIGQRIDRLINAAKLSEEEQQIVEEALLGTNRALLALVKTKRQK
jgi:transcriptional regulator with XRE-family HTH domain